MIDRVESDAKLDRYRAAFRRPGLTLPFENFGTSQMMDE